MIDRLVPSSLPVQLAGLDARLDDIARTLRLVLDALQPAPAKADSQVRHRTFHSADPNPVFTSSEAVILTRMTIYGATAGYFEVSVGSAPEWRGYHLAAGGAVLVSSETDSFQLERGVRLAMTTIPGIEVLDIYYRTANVAGQQA